MNVEKSDLIKNLRAEFPIVACECHFITSISLFYPSTKILSKNMRFPDFSRIFSKKTVKNRLKKGSQIST